MSRLAVAREKNEKGAVLVIVLIVMVASIMIGTYIMMLSTTDMRILGNENTYHKRFYESEQGLALALADTSQWADVSPDDEFSKRYVCGDVSATLQDDENEGAQEDENEDDQDDSPAVRSGLPPADVDVKIVPDGYGRPPVGSGWSVTALEAKYFKMTATSGIQPDNPDVQVEGTVTLQQGAWKIVPRLR